MKPNYSEGERADALFAATWVLLMLVRIFFANMGREDEALKTRTLENQLYTEFYERMGLGQWLTASEAPR